MKALPKNVVAISGTCYPFLQPTLDLIPRWLRDIALAHATQRMQETGEQPSDEGRQVLGFYKSIPFWIFNTEKARGDAIEAHKKYGPGGVLLLAKKRVAEIECQAAVLHAETTNMERGCLIRHLTELHHEKPISKVFCTSKAGNMVREWARGNGIELVETSNYTLLLAPWDAQKETGLVVSEHIADHSTPPADA